MRAAQTSARLPWAAPAPTLTRAVQLGGFLRKAACVGRLGPPRATRQRCAQGIRVSVHRTARPRPVRTAVAMASVTKELVSSPQPATKAAPTRIFVSLFATGATGSALTPARPSTALLPAIMFPTARRVARACSAATAGLSGLGNDVSPAPHLLPRWHRRPRPPSHPPGLGRQALQPTPVQRQCHLRASSPASMPSTSRSSPRTTAATPQLGYARTLHTARWSLHSARRRAQLAQACAKTPQSGPG